MTEPDELNCYFLNLLFELNINFESLNFRDEEVFG